MVRCCGKAKRRDTCVISAASSRVSSSLFGLSTPNIIPTNYFLGIYSFSSSFELFLRLMLQWLREKRGMHSQWLSALKNLRKMSSESSKMAWKSSRTATMKWRWDTWTLGCIWTFKKGNCGSEIIYIFQAVEEELRAAKIKKGLFVDEIFGSDNEDEDEGTRRRRRRREGPGICNLRRRLEGENSAFSSKNWIFYYLGVF